MLRLTAIGVVAALLVAACGAGESAESGFDTPERAVVAWFDAVDSDDPGAATAAVDNASLAVLLAVENDLDSDVLAEYIESGVPGDVAAGYWASFGEGFADFASRPVSTLTVGQSREFAVEAQTFAAVPISAGPGTESVVFTRSTGSGWEVDLVATLADGFGSLLADRFVELGSDDRSTVIRAAYLDTVAPALWAAMMEGAFGDDFNRIALTLVNDIEG